MVGVGKWRESSSIEQLEGELQGTGCDLETARDFLADADAALFLNSRPLLVSLFSWFRRYSTARGMGAEDLARVIQALTDELKRSTHNRLAEEIESIAAESTNWQPQDQRNPKGGRELFGSYLRLLLNHQGIEAKNLILEQVVGGKSIRYLHNQILEPALVEIGRLWLENQIDVADEHYATAITEGLMNTLHPFSKQQVLQKGRILLVAVQRELHALGLRMIGDFLELDGWETIYFGPNLPSESIRSAIEKERPDLIAMSVTTPSNLLATVEAIQQIRAMPTASSTPVIVGGYPFLVDRSMWRTVGADAWAANGFHAVRVARALFRAHRAPAPAFSKASGVSTDISQLRPFPAHKPNQNEELIRLMSELSALHTQLRKRNAMIEELNQEKTRFLGMAAHDLRNDIATATLITGLLEQKKEGLDDFKRRLVDRLNSLMRSMLDLVDGYLDVSRIEAGKLQIYPEPVDLISLVEDRIDVARFFADQAGVRLIRSGIDGVATANIDPKRIRQALNNVLLNAIKFSPKGGEVEIAVREDGEQYVIEVMDEGPGIPSEQAQRLFRPFGTIDTPGEKRKSGTGLGLHIARRVVEAHGGSIRFRPRTPRGSIFSLALPRLVTPQKIESA